MIESILNQSILIDSDDQIQQSVFVCEFNRGVLSLLLFLSHALSRSLSLSLIFSQDQISAFLRPVPGREFSGKLDFLRDSLLSPILREITNNGFHNTYVTHTHTHTRTMRAHTRFSPSAFQTVAPSPVILSFLFLSSTTVLHVISRFCACACACVCVCVWVCRYDNNYNKKNFCF